jgi:hypothetical protein
MKAASASRVRLPGALRALGAFAASLWLTGACCEGDRCEPPPPPHPEDCSDGACAISTPGCDPSTIAHTDAGEVCATCADPASDDDARICGVPEVARCEAREVGGESCLVCATELGEILHDSCYEGAAVDTQDCEVFVPPLDDPSLVGGGDVVCHACKDDTGAYVTRICEPASDECHEVDADGLLCRECTRDGVVVVRACEQPDIAPRSCERYSNEAGTCTDCYDRDDQLVLHSCALTGDVNISCSETITPDGLRCSVCVDANGTPVTQSCEPGVPELTQCTLLTYTEQSCVVCLDELGNPGLADCTRTDCAGDTCPPPPPCKLSFNEAGQQCRTCPVEATGGLEERCVEGTNLACTQVFDDVTGGACLQCVDQLTQREVYRRCDAETPPTCVNVEDQNGQLCEVCSDPRTGETVYASCGEQSCYDVGGNIPLKTVDGEALSLDHAPAVATCVECGVGQDSNVVATVSSACALRSDCGGIDVTAPDAACPGTVVYRLAPHVCENPWELAGYVGQGPGSLELLDILTWSLDTSGVGLISIHDAPGGLAECDACGCARGDTIDLVLRPDDAVPVADLFADVLVRCQSDADCENNGVCRIDGSCVQ